MARTKNIIDETKLDHLKKMVEQKFGRTIVTSKDCNDLVKTLLIDETTANINAQTIRRLFGLVKTTHAASVFTLDLLCNYVANCSWAMYNHQNKIDKSLIVLSDWIFELYANPKFGYTKVVDAIAEDENLQNLLLNRMADLSSAHWMFFENRPLRDSLNNTYINALIKYMHCKGDNEAHIFVYGMLFMGAFLTENLTDVEKYFHLINSIPLSNDVFQIPAARKFGVPLLYYTLKNDSYNFEKTLDLAIEARSKYVKEMEFDHVCFDIILLEHLLFTGNQEAINRFFFIYFQDKQKSRKKNQPYFAQIYLLVCAYNHKNFYRPVLKFDVNQLRIGERKFYNLLFVTYLLRHIKTSSKLKRIKLQSQLNSLIKATGYTYFNNLI